MKKTMKKMKSLILAVICSAGIASAAPGEGIVIHGDVLSSNGNPLKGSSVKVTNVCTNQSIQINTSEADGSYVFNGEYCNTYLIEASAEGYKAESKIVEVNAETVIEVKVKLAEDKKPGDKKQMNQKV
jgi:hypothetical protein